LVNAQYTVRTYVCTGMYIRMYRGVGICADTGVTIIVRSLAVMIGDILVCKNDGHHLLDILSHVRSHALEEFAK